MATADVIINNVTYPDVPSILIPKVGGGNAEFVLDGGGGSGATIATKTASTTSNATSIAFTNLSAQPKMFSVQVGQQVSLSSTRYVISVMSDGTTTYGTYGYYSSQTRVVYYSASYFSWTYSNGTLTVKSTSSSNGGYFRNGYTYRLIYAY